jgi:hypothetical protein
MENVGVEEVLRIRRQLVRDPGQPPDAEVHIVRRGNDDVRHAAERPRHEDGQSREDNGESGVPGR